MHIGIISIPLISLILSGCASVATQGMADRLSDAMLNQRDPEIVRTGAPAYLLLIDSMIADSPDNTDLLLAGSRLYAAYGSGLVKDPRRAKNLSATALDYSRRALCEELDRLCTALDLPFRDFEPTLTDLIRDDLPILYGHATAWVGWIQAHSDDWNAVAVLPKAERLLQKVVSLDPTYERGRAQLFLGALLSLRPAALGGQPELARAHFERAIEYSSGRDLMAKVEYARRYARLVFDQPLHDRLLNEVLKADPQQAGLTLSNVIAQSQARELLRDDYF